MLGGKGAGMPVAIIDIGSNSIRLVVYDGGARTPLPVFNEKAVCALGQGLGASGRLNPAGVELAERALGRFIGLARAMRAVRLDILATAAVRDAADGIAFVRRIESRHGVAILILSGGEEAELAAQGVLCGIPDADGIVADIGGGSCELVMVGGGTTGRHATMPLGVLRLSEVAGGSRSRAAEVIDGHLAGLDWLAEGRGRAVYASGGAWRAIARICIAQAQHPIRILDNYTLPRGEAARLVELISRLSRKSLENIPGVSRKRLPTLPLAALVLEKILAKATPARLVFSVYGLREGQFFKRLPPRLQRQDPLLAACRAMARSAGRFPEHADELMAWMEPLFPAETAAANRLRRAACLLGDVFWNEHPDYRAEQAFLRVLRLPFVGLGHRDRAELALALLVRYQGDEGFPTAQSAIAMLDDEGLRRARAVGLALRLGHTLTGGAPSLLRNSRFRVDGKTLVLELPADDATLLPEIADKPFDRLARAVGCDGLAVRLA